MRADNFFNIEDQFLRRMRIWWFNDFMPAARESGSPALAALCSDILEDAVEYQKAQVVRQDANPQDFVIAPK